MIYELVGKKLTIKEAISRFINNVKYLIVAEDGNIEGFIDNHSFISACAEGKSECTLERFINKNYAQCMESDASLDMLEKLLKTNKIIIIRDMFGNIRDVIDKEEIFKKFYYEVLIKLGEYKTALMKLGFSTPEQHAISKLGKSMEGSLQCIEILISSSLELNTIFENSSDSIYVTDGEGTTLRVNKTFHEMTGIKRKDVLFQKVQDLEKRGILNPSVNALALREKRRVTIFQEYVRGNVAIVTATPIMNEKGEIYRSVSNAKDLDESNNIKNYRKSYQKNIQEVSGNKDLLICNSKAMKHIVALVEQIKDTDSNILITGETGVGKGVLTRYIHGRSKRKKKRLIEINCGAIPETLLESELFGYESGAFTGARPEGKKGLIELADGGTLFLDEISELPLILQVKLLHFLQNRRITRVGGTHEIPVDTRIIAATNKDLEELVRKEKFRSDLFYRLNVIPIYIPPLRDRREDIEPAAIYFLEKYQKKYNKSFHVTQSFINEVVQNDWPGNMRQLENYIERAVVTNKGLYSFKQEIEIDEKEIGKAKNHLEINVNKIIPLKEAVEELEKKLVRLAYAENKSSYQVAKKLGISQATAYRKISKYIDK